MGKDGTQFLRLCVCLLVLVSTDLIGVDLALMFIIVETVEYVSNSLVLIIIYRIIPICCIIIILGFFT